MTLLGGAGVAGQESALARRLRIHRASRRRRVSGRIVPGVPEDTLAAYGEAIAHGMEVIDIDLRGTKDGAVVVRHDESVDRKTTHAS